MSNVDTLFRQLAAHSLNFLTVISGIIASKRVFVLLVTTCIETIFVELALSLTFLQWFQK